jgi:hypothetical protein
MFLESSIMVLELSIVLPARTIWTLTKDFGSYLDLTMGAWLPNILVMMITFYVLYCKRFLTELLIIHYSIKNLIIKLIILYVSNKFVKVNFDLWIESKLGLLSKHEKPSFLAKLRQQNGKQTNSKIAFKSFFF